MTSFSIENAQSNIFAWWMVEIEGLRYRWATYLPSWNPADSGVLQHIKRILADSPEYGGQVADALNGKTSIPQHRFTVQDNDGEITALLAVSNTPDNVTFLTASIGIGDALISVDDTTDFESSGDIYIDKETINYSSKVVTTDASAGGSNVSGTADADTASKVRLYDATRTEGNDYWKGSYVTFTSGSNSGQKRKVVQSIGDEITTFGSYYDVRDINRLYFDTSDPLPNNVSAGDAYILSLPPHKIRTTGLSSRDWTGARVTIFADSANPINIGSVRWIKSWDNTNNIMEFYDPLPAVSGAGTTFSTSHHQFAGCTRGMYSGADQAHSVLDEHGEEIKVTVQDRAPYMKGRRVWVREYRRTSTETDCKTRVGLIKDYKLTADGVSWDFKVAGLLHILSAKVLSQQNKAKVARLNLWGGNFKLAYTYRQFNWDELRVDEHHSLKACLEDGDTENMTTTDLFTTTQSLFPRNGGNIKIGKEILRYKERHMSSSLANGSLQVLTLGEVRDNLARNATDDDIKSGAYSPEKFGQQSRGLFASKIGLKDVRRSFVSVEWNKTVDGEQPMPPAINALMGQHNIDDEIVSVLLCDGTERSDFAQYDELEYSGEAGPMPTLPYTVTGDNSGATATIKYDDTTDSLLDVVALVGEFAPGEGVTASGWTATLVEYRKGDGKELPARNNTLSVLLQMLVSTGYGTSKYDTLGVGAGLGLDVDLIDIDSIESLRDLYFATSTIEFVLYETESFAEWAEKNIFTYLQIFPYETNEGKLSFSTIYTEAECQSQDTVASPIGDIDGDHFDITNLPDWDSGKDPITKVTIKYNKNPADKKFFGTMDVNFTRSARFYGDIGRTVEIETGCLYLPNELFTDAAPDDPRLPEFFKRVISPMWARHSSFPVPSIQAMGPYSDRVIDVGDIKKVTHPTLPNMRTGQRGLSGEYGQVMGVQPQPKTGKTALTIVLAGVHDSKYGMLSPSAVVYSVALATPSAGQMTVTLYQRNFAPRGQYDRDQFGVDDTVRFVSPAYDDIGASETASDSTIISIGTGSSMTIVMTQPTTPPANGDIMELQDYDNATSTRQGTLCWLAANTRIVGTDGNANKFK